MYQLDPKCYKNALLFNFGQRKIVGKNVAHWQKKKIYIKHQ